MKDTFRDSPAADHPDVTQKAGAYIFQAAEAHFKKALFGNLTLNYRVWLLKCSKNCNNAPFQFELQPFNLRYLLYSVRVQEGASVHVDGLKRGGTDIHRLNTDTSVPFRTMDVLFTVLIININYFPKEH